MKLNKVELSGVIAQEPTVRENKNGNAYIILDICENVYNTQSETTSPVYHTVKFSGAVMHIVENYSKGDTVLVEGKLTNYKHTDASTGTSYKVSMIQCFHVQRIYKKQNNDVQPDINLNQVPHGYDYHNDMSTGYEM